MAISFDYYKVFYYVAKYQNITTASKALFLSQPTVSHHIRNLEAELGCTLFIRSKKGVLLTPEAKLLYRHISRACEHIFEAEAELNIYKSLSQGIIRIGAGEMTLQHYLLPYLEKFREQYPSIKLEISNNTTPLAVSSLKAGFLDFAIVVSPIENDENLTVTRLSSFQDIAIAGTLFSHLKDLRLHISDLTDYPLICMAQATSTRKFWDHLFLDYGAILNPAIELSTTDLITPTVRHNLGIGFVPYEFARSSIASGTVYQLDIEEKIPKRHICLISNSDHPISLAGLAFVKMLTE